MTYAWLGARWARASCILALGAALACSEAIGTTPPQTDGGAASIQFTEGSVVTLAPSDTLVLDLAATGVASANVSLVGSYLDAFLDASSVDLSSGQAHVTLHAPSSASTFSVLAASGDVTARLDVSVSATGFATVRVTVDYQGKRAVPIVAASTFIEQTCAELGTSAQDGSPLVYGTDGETLVIPSVPTDGRVAVAVRIAHYATGCVDITSLTPNQIDDVTVPVFDLPLDLADSSLDARFTFAPDPGDATSLASYFAGVADTVIDATFSEDEAGGLLDAMQSASTSPSAFGAARDQNDWDSAVSGWLAQHTPSMHERVATWMAEAALGTVGDLTGSVTGAASKPTFAPSMLGPLDAASAGVTAQSPFTWSGQANDVLSLTGTIQIVSSELACAAADYRASVDVENANGVVSALVSEIDCGGLGTELANGGDAFGQCDATCMSDLCASGLAAEWAAGAKSLAQTTNLLSLSINVAAPVDVGDAAQVESYAGSWVGSFSTQNTSVSTKGIAKAANGTLPN